MRNFLSNITLLTISLAVALSASEILVRLFFPAPQMVSIKKTIAMDRTVAAAKARRRQVSLSHHPEQGGVYIETAAGRRLRANIDALIENHSLSRRSILIKTNSLGYRNREIGQKKGARILFLGDSITFGDYLSEEETFVRLVEGIARDNGEDWETINAGVGGISLQNELTILKETGLSTDPDVVVLGFYLNDFQESFFIPPVPLFLKSSRLAYFAARAVGEIQYHVNTTFFDTNIDVWEKEFERNVALEKGDYRKDEAAFNFLILNSFHDWGGAWSPRSWETLKPYFEELKMLSIVNNFKLLFLVFPVRYQVDAMPIHDFPQLQLKKIGAALDTPVLDVLPVLREKYEARNEQLFYDQCHHTPYGNRIIAAGLYTFLKRHIDALRED